MWESPFRRITYLVLIICLGIWGMSDKILKERNMHTEVAFLNCHTYLPCIYGRPNFCPISLMLSFVTPALCHPITQRKYSSYSFATAFLVFTPHSFSPRFFWELVYPRNKNKSLFPAFSQLTWMKYTRVEANTVWTLSLMGLNSWVSGITHWVSITSFPCSATSFPCSAPCLTSWPRGLRRETFLSNKSLFSFLSFSLLVPLGFLFSVVFPFPFILASFSFLFLFLGFPHLLPFVFSFLLLLILFYMSLAFSQCPQEKDVWRGHISPWN